MSPWRPSAPSRAATRSQRYDISSVARLLSSGTSRPLSTHRLIGRHATTSPRVSATRVSQREARHVQGQAGSKKNVTSAMAGFYPETRLGRLFSEEAAGPWRLPAVELRRVPAGPRGADRRRLGSRTLRTFG